VTLHGGASPAGPLRLGTALLGALLLRGDVAQGWLPPPGDEALPHPPANGATNRTLVLPDPVLRQGAAPLASQAIRPGSDRALAAGPQPRVSKRARLLAGASPLPQAAVPVHEDAAPVLLAGADLPQPDFLPSAGDAPPASAVPEASPPEPPVGPVPGEAPAAPVHVASAAPPEAGGSEPVPQLPATVATVAIAAPDTPATPAVVALTEPPAPAELVSAGGVDEPQLAQVAHDPPELTAVIASPSPQPLVQPAADAAAPPVEVVVAEPTEQPAEVAASPSGQAVADPQPTLTAQSAAAPPVAEAAPPPAPVPTAGTIAFPEPELAVAAASPPSATVASLAVARNERTASRTIPARRAPVPAIAPAPAAMPAAPAPLAANDAPVIFPQPAFGSAPRSDPGPPPAPATGLAASRPEPSAGLSPQPSAPAPARPQTAGLAPSPGSASFPSAGAPTFSYDDELILQIRVAGVPGDDTLIAYGTQSAVYLPFGALARFLDLGIAVSDEGHYASGWFLDEARTLTIDLRERRLTVLGKQTVLDRSDAIAFDGELYLRAERYADLLPLSITTDLRDQSVTIRTSEPFPFEQKLKREAEREKLASRSISQTQQRWPREETPWRALSLPMADLELRAVSDSTFATRGEADLRLAGDLAFMSAKAFLGLTSRDGLVSSNISLGRVDGDGDLLGPLRATEFEIGDVATPSLALGLRGSGGRGAMVGNLPVESRSVFDRIDLRGSLPDGQEVELYRNGVLIDSTREAVNGEYRFEQVSLDYGINVLRLVFYGPQGQRSEEVRQISVGDGRLAKGQFVYAAGVAQKDVNLLDVRGPRFRPGQDFGAWRGVGHLSYGLSAGLTATMGGAWFQSDRGTRWLATAGLRTGVGGVAAKFDLGMSDHGAKAAEIGLGGRLLGVSLTLNHAEYRGRFIDEVRSLTSDYLKRVTELDANATLTIGSGLDGLSIPLTARARRIEFRDGRVQTSAALRASTRFSGLVASNVLDYSETGGKGIGTRRQLLGNFDLATLSRSKLQVRASAGYAILPDPRLVSAAIEVDRAIDSRTLLHGSVSHSFQGHETQFGASAVRRFDRFTLAVDGSYGVKRKSYAVGLRLGASIGRNSLDGRMFLAPPGQASSGGIALRAFRDADGDRRFGPGDEVLPDVEFFAGNRAARSDADGIAMMTGLGSGNRASVQVDIKTLPDIDLAPVSRGIEIVPRPGRIHATDFAVVEMSEIEGTAYFAGSGAARGVSGLRLQLVDAIGKPVKAVKTESDGFYLFEQVQPGRYAIVLDAEQADRLHIRLGESVTVEVGAKAAVLSRKLVVEPVSP
jgi:hypothetical protein